jgi:hypothetical protein
VLATAVPAAIVVVPLAVLGAFKPYKLTEALGSLQAMAVLAGIAVVWVALALALWRFTGPVVRGLAMGLLSVVLAVVLVVPSLRDVRLVEDRQDLATVRVGPDGTGAPTTAPDPAGAGPATTATVPPVPDVPAGPTHVAGGPLRGIGHGASGTANLFRQADGTDVVELLDIDIDPGPDYLVYVAPGLDAESPGAGAVELGPLKGNLGTQYYEVPSGADLSGERSVLVWCRAFAVPVAAAPLTPV